MVILGKARVSTLEQSVNSHALEQQIQRLKDSGCIEIISDVESGRKKKKHLEKIIERCEQGDITEVVATRIDCITRNLPKLREFADFCAEKGINLKILDQHIDLSTPHGRLMLTFLGGLAEWESDLLTSRVQHGISHQQKQGRAPGIMPFGYRRSSDNRYEINTDLYKDTNFKICDIAAEIIETFIRTESTWKTTKIIEAKYGIGNFGKGSRAGKDFPRHMGIDIWIKNPMLRGYTVYYWGTPKEKWYLNPDIDPSLPEAKVTHQALISEKQWIELQKIIKTDVRPRKEYSQVYPLSGLIYCGKCGARCKAHKGQKRKDGSYKTYWYCSLRTRPTKQCSSKGSVTNEFIEEQVIQLLNSKEGVDQISQRMLVKNNSDKVVDSPELIKKRAAFNAIKDIDLDDLNEAKQSLRSQIQQLENEILRSSNNRDELFEDLKRDLADPLFITHLRERDQLRRFFMRFVSKILVKEDLSLQIQTVFDDSSSPL
jgi:DNA invertase Pin-like site-specific DNA recombinase